MTATRERFPNQITDKVFSRWHRTLPALAACIDIDMVEYCARCREPLAFIETAKDVGQDIKPVTVLRRIAERADIPAFVLLMTFSEEAHLRGDDANAILRFRARRFWPPPETDWRTWTPQECAAFIVGLRSGHVCASDVRRRAA